ncbi:hypothetical protein [Microcystis phage Mvi-JY20]|uniref:Uncharacterized protein n=1 Tax=Microcystis phage Mvi-JY20 TaxID=3128146 RepID=A0AAX4QGU0_9CAUD
MANIQAEPTRFNQYIGFRIVAKGPVDPEVIEALSGVDNDPIMINRLLTRVFKATCTMHDIEPGTPDSRGIPIHHPVGAWIDEVTRAGIDHNVRYLDEYTFTGFSIGVVYER